MVPTQRPNAMDNAVIARLRFTTGGGTACRR